MAIDTATIANATGDHVVQFYERDSELVEIVGRWLRDTAPEDVSIVVATPAHREQFAATVAADGIEASPHSRVIWLDAAATLEQLIVAGEIDPAAFDAVIGDVVRRATEAARTVRVYGEMVALLWSAGNVVGAIDLEGLWNDLANETPFALLCAYPSAIHDDSERPGALAKVCGAHSACYHTWSDKGTAVIHASASQGARAAFPPGTSAPSYARRVTLNALRQWGYAATVVEDAGLVVSELVTNAVLHAGSHLTLSVRCDNDHALRLAVQDATPLASPTNTSPFDVERRHGLGIVAAIAAAWGVEHVRDGKIVWAQMRA
jgi:anti-sigma regulatory factor (Ser/Thr protein kinase)